MAQQLRALVALLENPGLSPSNCMAVYNPISSLLASTDTRHTHSTQTYMQAKHSYTWNKINFKNLFYCIITVCVHTSVLWHPCEGQRSALCSQFSPSTFYVRLKELNSDCQLCYGVFKMSYVANPWYTLLYGIFDTKVRKVITESFCFLDYVYFEKWDMRNAFSCWEMFK